MIARMVLIAAAVAGLVLLRAADAADGWDIRAPHPGGASMLSAATGPDGRIYAFGGVHGLFPRTGYILGMFVYDPGTDTWTQLDGPARCTQGTHGALVSLGGVLYAVAGHNQTCAPGAAGLDTLDAFDPSTGAWTARAPLPTARWALDAAAVDGRLYAVGGLRPQCATCSWDAVATVEEYDPAADRWTARAPLPIARGGLAVVAGPNGRVYAIGGEYTADGRRVVSGAVHEYDPTLGRWSSRAPLPTPRSFLAAALGADGRIYAVGGMTDAGSESSVVEVYDPAADAWTAFQALPASRSSPAAAVGGDGQLYVIGGTTFIGHHGDVYATPTCRTGGSALPPAPAYRTFIPVLPRVYTGGCT